MFPAPYPMERLGLGSCEGPRRETTRDKRGTEASGSCGRREAPAAKPLGVRPAARNAGRAGRHLAGGRPGVGPGAGAPGGGGTRVTWDDCVAAGAEATPVLMENRERCCETQSRSARGRERILKGPGPSRNGRTDTGPPAPTGGPVRSIRKNHFLPGSGPTERFRSYGKNGIVHGVEGCAETVETY